MKIGSMAIATGGGNWILKQGTYPDDASGRVLRDMQASGADMTIPYDVDFEHIFPDVGAAETFSKLVARRGCKTELREYDAEGSSYYWQVCVVVRLVPTYRGITKLGEDLGSVAEK